MTAAAVVGPPITRKRRTPSAVGFATRVADVAHHVDDAGAVPISIGCGGVHYEYFADGSCSMLPVEHVTVHTDGPGFLLLVEHFELRVVTDGGNIYGNAEIGPFEQPVLVFAALTQTLAAGLAATS